ncbi:MAG: family 16 glycosylhydrolase [Rikenellaceae bacterium]
MKEIVSKLFLVIALSFLSCESEPSTSSGDDDVSTYLSTPHNSNLFSPIVAYTDEFDEASVDFNKWNTPDDAFASWGFKEENVRVEDGDLRLTVKYDKYSHEDSSKEYFYFSSGMLRSKTTRRYGYYEARIKGADLWPGTCSAFWLYTKGIECEKEVYNITYNEIDVIEIQQIASDKRMMASNIHVYAYNESLVNTFYSAGKYPDMGQNQFLVDYDAEDDYHIYACENRPDSIVFYIDNVRTAAKANHYWHLEQGMYIALSLGLRTPFEYYDDDGVRWPTLTTEDEATEAGFPVDMIVDYIRVYERDYTEFPSDPKTKFSKADFTE